MNENLKDLMRDATRLTRAGQLTQATALLQQLLRGNTAASTAEPAGDLSSHEVLDGCVFEIPDPGVVATDSVVKPVGDIKVPPIHLPGEFVNGVHSHASLTRRYKLYVPPTAGQGRALPLIVMLHGCTQNPDDFAAGTGMNELARREGFFVLYPEQARGAKH